MPDRSPWRVRPVIAGPATILGLAVLPWLVPAPVKADPLWSWRTPRPTGVRLEALAVGPDDTVVAVGLGGTVVVSGDAGLTWSQTSRLGEVPWLRDVVVLPTGELLAVGDAPVAYLSASLGATWTEIPVPGDADALPHVSMSPAGEVWIGTDDGRLLRGDAALLDFAEAVDLAEGPIHDLDFAGAIGFAATYDGAFRSLDGGTTWAPVPGPGQPFEGFFDVTVRNADEVVLYEAFSEWTSTDGGDTWTERTGFDVPDYFRRALWLGPGQRLVALDGEGAEIWSTLDDGLTWTRLLQMPFSGVSDLLRGPGGRLFAITSAGDLLRSDDDGITWTNAVTRPGGVPGPVSCLGRVPGTDVVLAGVQAGFPGAGLLRSVDGGVHWTDAALDVEAWQFVDVAFPTPDLGVAGGLSAAGRVGVYLSTDQGASWTYTFVDAPEAPFRLPEDLDVAPDGSITLFAQGSGIDATPAVYRRLPDATWERRDAGLPAGFWKARIAFGDADHGLLLDEDGRFFETEDGTTWTPHTPVGLPPFRAVGLAFTAPTVALSVVDHPSDPAGSGVYRSDDGGDTWSPVWTGHRLRVLSVDHAASTAAAAWYEAPLAVSRDAGSTWDTVVPPFTHFAFSILASPDGLLLGTANSAIVGMTLDDVVAVASPPVPSRPELVAAPTPFRDRVALSFTAPVRGTVSIEVHDAGGRRVFARTSPPLEAGDHILHWDGRDARGRPVPVGVYWARVVQDGQRVGTTRVVRR